MDGLEELEKALQETVNHKSQLEAKAKLCEDRMNRAFRLIGGLADERQRWINTIAAFQVAEVNVVGDILISAGTVIKKTFNTAKKTSLRFKKTLPIIHVHLLLSWMDYHVSFGFL